MLAFKTVAIIGLGLIGSSIARAIRSRLPDLRLTGFDQDLQVRTRARQLELGEICETADDAVREADLIILCVPVGAMRAAALSIADAIPSHAIVSDVGSAKAVVADILRDTLPNIAVIPAHPVAGTENSGPDAGSGELFRGRWCILTPGPEVAASHISSLADLWSALGARVEIMDAHHHDLVLAVTSHLPHLIAYTIVGTASDLEQVTQSEVIAYSAGGFRDFTRIAASNPTMWRDIFLANREAVLDILGRFNSDLERLAVAIREGDGDTLFDLFTRTRAIRRSIVEQGQDVAAADFGRLTKPAV